MIGGHFADHASCRSGKRWRIAETRKHGQPLLRNIPNRIIGDVGKQRRIAGTSQYRLPLLRNALNGVLRDTGWATGAIKSEQPRPPFMGNTEHVRLSGLGALAGVIDGADENIILSELFTIGLPIGGEFHLSVIIVGVDVEADALGGGNLILLHVLYLAGSVVDTVENPLYLLVGQVQIAELVPDLLHALLSVALT